MLQAIARHSQIRVAVLALKLLSKGEVSTAAPKVAEKLSVSPGRHYYAIHRTLDEIHQPLSQSRRSMAHAPRCGRIVLLIISVIVAAFRIHTAHSLHRQELSRISSTDSPHHRSIKTWQPRQRYRGSPQRGILEHTNPEAF